MLEREDSKNGALRSKQVLNDQAKHQLDSDYAALSDWQKVRRKRKRRNKKNLSLPKAKPDAIMIERKDQGTYAKILKKVKSDPKCSELMESIKRIRRTQKGEQFLELTSTNEEIERLRTLVSDSLGQEVAVRALSQKTFVEVMDIDEITSKEKICEAIKLQFLHHFTINEQGSGTFGRWQGENRMGDISHQEEGASNTML